MEELYQLIETKIKASGYPGDIDGREFYRDVSEEADKQENGTYVFMIKKTDEILYKGCMDIMDKEFELPPTPVTLGTSPLYTSKLLIKFCSIQSERV